MRLIAMAAEALSERRRGKNPQYELSRRGVEVRERALTSFVLLEASWPSDKSHRLISKLRPTHIIVHRAGPPQDTYYLLRVDDSVRRLLKSGAPDLDHAWVLDQRNAVPLVPATEEAERAPERCVVHEKGLIVGFFDAGFARASALRQRPPSSADHAATRHTRREAGRPIAAAPGLFTRDLRAEFPKEVKLDASVSLLISIGGAGAEVSDLPAGTTVDIVVQPRHGFEVEGRAKDSLQVGHEENIPVQFKMRGTALGRGEIRVLTFHQGQAVGAITLRPLVLPAQARTGRRGAHTGPLALAPTSIRLPDVTLLIDKRSVEGKPAFLFRLTTRDGSHNLTPFGPVVLETDAARYFDDFFKDIEVLPLDSATQRAIAEQQLRAKGAILFDKVFPPELRKTLWGLSDSNLSMLVQSDEPWIPWELCRLSGEVDGDIVDGTFLCEAFNVTRWQPGIPFKSPLKLTNMALVVPEDSALALAEEEREAVLALSDGDRNVTRISANFLDLQLALASGEYDGWHFTGHGAHQTPDPNKAELVLESGQAFRPENLAGEIRRLGRARPLVFLNACQTGRGGMSLTGIGGWAREFLSAGAGAFIGTYWSVSDEPACAFAMALYDHLLRGDPIGKAVQAARITIKDSSDPTTWLAYTVFADPTAMLEPICAPAEPPRPPIPPPEPTTTDDGGSGTGTTRTADVGQGAVSEKERGTDGSRLAPEEADAALKPGMQEIINKRGYDNIDRFVLVFHNRIVETMSKDSDIPSTWVPDKADSRAFSGDNCRAFDFWSDDDEWATIQGGDNFSYQLLFNPPYSARWDMQSHGICYVQAYYHKESRIKEIVPRIKMFEGLCHTHLPGFSINLSKKEYIPYQKMHYELNAEFLKRCLSASRQLVLGMNTIHSEILTASGLKGRRKK